MKIVGLDDGLYVYSTLDKDEEDILIPNYDCAGLFLFQHWAELTPEQISKTDFVIPFDRWYYEPQTSTTRKPYDRMVTIATRFKQILEENGL